MSAPALRLLLVAVVGCMRCGDASPEHLYALASGPYRRLCASCWREMGCPWPGPARPEEQHEAEVKTRERMTARGGTDRHLVRSGKS